MNVIELIAHITLDLHRQALRPEQVVALHIDNGFMRRNESELVEESLSRLGVKLKGEL